MRMLLVGDDNFEVPGGWFVDKITNSFRAVYDFLDSEARGKIIDVVCGNDVVLITTAVVALRALQRTRFTYYPVCPVWLCCGPISRDTGMYLAVVGRHLVWSCSDDVRDIVLDVVRRIAPRSVVGLAGGWKRDTLSAFLEAGRIVCSWKRLEPGVLDVVGAVCADRPIVSRSEINASGASFTRSGKNIGSVFSWLSVRLALHLLGYVPVDDAEALWRKQS